ncbi:MAG: hypothetical protein CMC89_00310 [Flavobacteriaceae bacterium]|nr:hypothetical protein [Flavobacteriaceae bacterium]|tara:strand:- start:509 stop:1039 length:531 start_codon:yes stop_codon:yes gene_type:complete
MKDILDVIKNIQGIYESDMAFTILKDFERVLDDLDVYVYENWADGELVFGPNVTRHWVTCAFMWDIDKMPDPSGGKRLLDYDCRVTYKKDRVIKPRKIRTPDDVRPGTKKGKLDTHPIWVVEIMMPKKLIADIYGGYKAMNAYAVDPATQPSVPAETQPAEAAADATMDAETPEVA